MEFDQDLPDSPRSLGSSSYDSASSIREREDIANSLQDRIKVLLKVQKRNEKLKQSVEEFKRKIEQYKNSFKDLQEQFKEILQALELPEDSPLLSILEKIKSFKETQMLFQEINDMVDDPNNTNKKEVISIIKEHILLKQAITEILGKNKSIDELITDIKDLKKAKKVADSTLKELGTNNFEYLIENQQEIEQQYEQICSSLGIKNINNKNMRHKNIISAINELKNKPNEIFNELGQLISPNMTEKVEDIQDVKRMINELKQKAEKSTAELQSHKNSLSQLHMSTFDDVTSIVSDLLTKLNIKSPALIQSEISKKLKEKDELTLANEKISEELQKTKSLLSESRSKMKIKEDEFDEISTKLNELQQKYHKIENEKNSLKGSINDKDEEINSLKSLLQSEKGNVKLKFDEFNDQILSLKSDIKNLQTKNEELVSNQMEMESKNNELTNDLESAKKAMKKQIDTNNELNQKVDDFENKNEALNSKLDKIKKEKDELISQIDQTKIELDSKDEEMKKIQREFNELNEIKTSLETKLNISKKKSDQLQKILNADDSDHIGSQIQDMLTEISELKNSNNQLIKERQNISKILKIENEHSISETITDLLELNAEQKAENQDLTQKISAIASFLNIQDPQSATLATIQKTIRNLQKELESEQNEKLKMKNENESLNQKYEVLLDTQNEIQNSLNCSTFKSSNELIKAVSENEKLISKACELLNVNKDDLLKKISSNNEIVSEICKELNTDESSLIQIVQKQKKSIEKAADVLNVSGSSIEKVIEDNNDIMNKVCKSLNCSKEKIADQVERNTQILNNLLKQSNCENIDQLSDEFSNLKKAAEKSKQQLDDAMNKLNINSSEKINSTLTDLQKDAEKASFLEKKASEISSLMNLQDGQSIDDVKHSVQNLMIENKRLNDTMTRIQSIMNSSDILNSITLMATIMKSIQKILPKSTDMNEIPTVIGHYKNDSESYNKIQQIFPSRDPFNEITDMQKELKDIYSIFNMKKFEDPIELIKLNNDFANSVVEIVENSSGSRKTKSLNSSNNQELIKKIQKTFNDQREIMNLLKTESPLDAVKKLIEKKREISQIVDMNSDEEPTEIIQKVVGLKNDLSSLLDVNETSDILSTIQKQKQTNKDLFSILNVDDSNKLVSKATELAEIESLLKKFNPDEKNCKEAILKNEKEKKEMSEFISKLSTLLKLSTNSSANSSASSISSHSSHGSSKSGKNSIYKQILKRVHRMVKTSNEVCQLLNCSESSLIEQITKMKNDLESINEMFNSDASDETKIIQSAKNEKQILKNLKKTVDVNKYSEILPRVNEYQNEIKDLQEKLNETEIFKSKLSKIFDISNNSTQNSIEKKAEENKLKLNKFNDLVSLMNCEEDEVKSLILNLLHSTNSSSIKEIPNFISSMKEKVERLSQKIQNDTSILSGFLGDGENDGQFVNSENIVQLTLTKFKQKIFQLEEKVSNFDKEINRHANFIKNTNNLHYSLDEIQAIFRSHEEQILHMKALLSNGNHQSELNDFSSIIQKVEQLKLKLKEAALELSKSHQIIDQRNYEISAILSACAAKSPEFAIDIINSMKKQISELNKEVAELKTYQIVEESFKSLESKEKQIFSVIVAKLNDINGVLQALLFTIDNGRCQKAELRKLIEGALLQSINLREKLEANEEKWMLFGSNKKTAKKLTLSDEIRIKKKELTEQQRRADKAEGTVNNQQNHHHRRQQIQQHQQPHTLL